MAKKTRTTETPAVTKTATVNTVDIGISEKNRQAIANDLQVLLADEVVLYNKTRNFHWNVEGMHFGQLHKLFEEQYEAIADLTDEVAERIRKIGHYAVGNLADFLKLTHLVEHLGEGSADSDMIRALTEDHETIIRFVRNLIDTVDNKYGDAGTADFLTGLMEEHEKMAWMLRAHLV